MEEWCLLSGRVGLRLSAALFGVLVALSTSTPETADAIVAPLCALVGPSCVPEVLRPKIMALAALSAILLKLWRELFPDDAVLTVLPRRAGPLLVALAALGLGGCAGGACPVTAELVGSIASDGTWGLECRIREEAPPAYYRGR